MKRGGLWLVVAMLAIALVYGVAALYRLRISRGDVFPAYSSLRADPLGVRALHDAAALLPGLEVVRWMRPLERLQAGAGDAVYVIGLNADSLPGMEEADWLALDRTAVAGAHVVVAWHASAAKPEDGLRMREIRANPWRNKPAEITPAKKPAQTDQQNDSKGKPGKALTAPKESFANLATAYERRWGFRLGRRQLMQKQEQADALRGEQAPKDWPVTLARWRSDLFFIPRADDGWKVLYRRGAEPVMMECTRGKGSVTLLADSFVLSNEAVQTERATPLLAALFGDAKRVIFVESHLGIEVDSGVAVLARRYGLGAAALTALILAGLWIWRSATPLAPIIEEDAEVRLLLAPTAGLEALLSRAVPTAKLFAACMDSWRSHATAGDQARLAKAALPAGDQDPVNAYNAATQTLSHKRIP